LEVETEVAREVETDDDNEIDRVPYELDETDIVILGVSGCEFPSTSLAHRAGVGLS
jgi:hypothetical protein